MSILLHQISNNEIDTLELQDEAEVAFDNEDGRVHEFLAALKTNTSITTVNLSGDFLCCLRADAREKVLNGFTSSRIQTVTIADTLLLVQDLAHLVQNLSSLKSLTVDNLILQGQDSDFKAFEASLMQHPSLKEFDMGDNCKTAIKKVCDLSKMQEIKKASAAGKCTAMPSGTKINSAIAKSA
ncbi:MAG: hypothetical protein SGARI_000088 [Bacillariaceae sp.]